MTIKFAANGVFRSEVRKYMKNNPYDVLSEKDLENLNLSLDELEKLAVKDKIDGARDFIGPHVGLVITTEFLELSMDPPRTAELFFNIHEVIKDHFVPVEIYRTMNMALDEINVHEINPELEIAIKGALSHIREDHYNNGYRPNYCPIAAIRKHNKGKER